MEEKDITKDFIKVVSSMVPEIAGEIKKNIKVTRQGNYVLVKVLGKERLDLISQKEIAITQAVSEIIPNPKILFSAVDFESPRSKTFKQQRQSYTFSNFLVSNTNRSAFYAAKEVSQEPTGQPMVISGPPAVGKTHLLKALRYSVKRSDKNYSIILLNMGKIVNDIFFHMKNKTLEKYLHDLHSSNYLLIDDLQKAIQQVSGKALQRIDSILFDLYEDFFENDEKQLVFAVDRSPMQLPLSDRVRSRLFSGYTYFIDPPDDSIKRTYVERVLKNYEPLSIPDKIKEIIIKKSINFRYIEELTQTAVKRYSETGDDDYVATQISVLAKTMNKGKLRLTADDVIDAVCKLTGTNRESILNAQRIRGRRTAEVAWIITYILVKKLYFGLKDTASVLNKKSTMTIARYLKFAEANRIDDMDFLIEMNEIMNEIFHNEVT